MVGRHVTPGLSKDQIVRREIMLWIWADWETEAVNAPSLHRHSVEIRRAVSVLCLCPSSLDVLASTECPLLIWAS